MQSDDADEGGRRTENGEQNALSGQAGARGEGGGQPGFDGNGWQEPSPAEGGEADRPFGEGDTGPSDADSGDDEDVSDGGGTVSPQARRASSEDAGDSAENGSEGATSTDAHAEGAEPASGAGDSAAQGGSSNGAGTGSTGASGENGSQDGDAITIDGDLGQSAPPSIGNRPGQQRTQSSIVPVAVYRIDESGTLHIVPEVTSASIPSDVLKQAAEYALQADDGFGTLPALGLHYDKAERDGETFLAFADTSYTDGWKSLALMLALVGAGTLVVFFVISLFYSRWALKPVREAWDSQKQFVADASHDLKTPLTVILANAAILLKHPERSIASESQWIESTQKEAEDMQGLVNEMLELAQIEAGQQRELVREPVDLSDLVDGETLLFDSVALERGYAFDCSIEAGVRVLGDEKQLKKLVSTLVENAFKYVEEGGTVSISVRRAGKRAQVAIGNTGSTIAPEDLPHIFDRFYRTDKARTSGAGGFGLGLAIARGIAQQHGGDITCTSSPDEGTTFTVQLPLTEREERP